MTAYHVAEAVLQSGDHFLYSRPSFFRPCGTWTKDITKAHRFRGTRTDEGLVYFDSWFDNSPLERTIRKLSRRTLPAGRPQVVLLKSACAEAIMGDELDGMYP